jgi:tetratricopeptide (TPR) repeat protein
MTIPARPFTEPTQLGEEQLRIMYQALPTKGRLVADGAELALIEAALLADPNDYYLWCARAAMVSSTEDAIESYSRALAVKPLSSHALYNRGRKLLGSGRHAQAFADLRASTLLDPDEAWKWHFQGVALYFLDLFDDAVEVFEEAIEAGTRAGDHLLPFEIEWMWNCYSKAGKPEAAARCLERVDETTPVLESEATYKKRILLYRGLLDEDAYVASIDPADPLEMGSQLYGLANYHYYVRGDSARSLEVLKQVLDLYDGRASWGYQMATRDLAARTA